MTIHVHVCGKTDVGVVRTNNEDSFVVADLTTGEKLDLPSEMVDYNLTQRGILLALSDGMGGQAAGEVASAMVLESLRRELVSEERSSVPTELIDRAVRHANRDVWQTAKAPEKRGMGATLTAVMVIGGAAFIAEVGDSRAYLIRGQRIRQVTKDQSFVQFLLEAGVLKPDEAAQSPHKNVILQAMGQSEDVRVAIGRLELRRADKLLLCSDGLSNKVTSEEMFLIVDQSPDLAAACSRLVDLAKERGGEDNITVVIGELVGDGLMAPAETETVTATFKVVQDFDPATANPRAPGDHPRKAATGTGPAPKEPAGEPVPEVQAPEPAAVPARTGWSPSMWLTGLLIALLGAAVLAWVFLRG